MIIYIIVNVANDMDVVRNQELELLLLPSVEWAV